VQGVLNEEYSVPPLATFRAVVRLDCIVQYYVYTTVPPITGLLVDLVVTDDVYNKVR